MRGRLRHFALALGLLSLLGSCGFAGAGAMSGNEGKSITVGIVANPQMQDIAKMIGQFEQQNPGANVRFVTLPENEARQKITESVATGSREFDVVMISNYETPMWAKNGWLVNLQPLADRTAGYDPNDIIPSVRKSLSYKGNLYSVPFYGESSFLMYRKDLFAKAGLKMPAHPTWQQVATLAAQLDDKKNSQAGICLRGLPGWGELLAPLDTVINTFGGRWYDQKWHAQLDSPQVNQAVSFYTKLLTQHGEPGAGASGYTQCLTNFSQGNSAMWYDSTAGAGTLEDPASSKVAGKVGYVAAPVVKTKASGWLYTWSLGIPKTSKNRDLAWKFTSWATSKQYIKSVGSQLGWSHVPPASRLSTYDIPQYQKLAGPFAQPTLDAMNSPTIEHPTVQPVPYQGVQFLDIPEFMDLGTRVSQQVSAAIAGQKSVKDALTQAQKYAATVGESYVGR
jgi:sorbitol/mannitol transport system substrate-binding protein